MLTKNDLLKINLDQKIIVEIIQQAEKRLADYLATKKDLEQKATVFLNVCLAIITLLLSSAIALYKTGFGIIIIPLVLAAICLIAPACFFAAACKSQNYGALGSNPSLWLIKKYVDEENAMKNAHTKMLAFIAVDYQERIKASFESNERKASYISWGINTGLIALITLIISSIICFNIHLVFTIKALF